MVPTVRNMLEKASNREWVIPNFQREFVWTAKQIANLFDSIARGYPIGAIILLKYKKYFDFQARSLDGSEDENHKHKFYIIDGQQRLTALYKIMREHSNTPLGDESQLVNHFTIHKTPKNQGDKQNWAFFYNLEYDVKDKDISCVKTLKEQKKTLTKDFLKRNRLVPLEHVFNSNTKPKCVNMLGLKKRDRIKIDLFKKKINNYKLTIHTSENDWDLDDYRTVFLRLNSAGTDLSAFDECASILNDLNFNLHKKWASVSAQEPHIKTLDIDPMYILKTMFLIYRIKNQINTISAPSLKNLKHFFKNECTDKSTINDIWIASVRYLNKACRYLIEQYGARDKRLIPYAPMVVTLSCILYYFEKQKYASWKKEFFNSKVKWWYWSSVFSAQYESGTDNKIATHLKKLIEWCNLKNPKQVKWPSNKIDIKELDSDISRLHINSDARYRAILCLPLRNSSKDILQNNIDNFHDHHIFTKDAFAKKLPDVEQWKINNIANRIALDETTNTSIGNICPFEYGKKGISIARSKKRDFLLPENIFILKKITKKNFRTFLHARRALIIDEIKPLLIKPKQVQV